MKITIVIPVYNVEPYIEDCLKSVAAQTYKGDIECIVVDDCTPDGSCAIIERFIKEYNGNIDFKLLHHSVNRGLSAARNTGIDAATGDYIYFLDSDDEITPDCIELLAAPLEKEKYDFVIGDYAIIGHKVGVPPLLLEGNKMYKGKEIMKTFFTAQWYVMACNKLCDLNFLKKKKLYFEEELIHEDEIWSFQLACTAQSMSVVKKATYIYKVRVSSITDSRNKRQKAYALSKIVNLKYIWAKKKGLICEKDVLKDVFYNRETVFSLISSLEKYKERRKIYLECYKNLRIEPWKAYKSKTIKKTSLIKELYNYLPGILGYWYICLYNFIMKRK